MAVPGVYCAKCLGSNIDVLASSGEVKRYQCKNIDCRYQWALQPELPKDHAGRFVVVAPTVILTDTDKEEDVGMKRECEKCGKVLSTATYKVVHQVKCKGAKVQKVTAKKPATEEARFAGPAEKSMPGSLSDVLEMMNAKREDRIQSLINSDKVLTLLDKAIAALKGEGEDSGG